MTTLFVNMKDGVLYSDSRATHSESTWFGLGKDKNVRFSKATKISREKGLLLGSVGSLYNSNMVRKALVNGSIHQFIQDKTRWKMLAIKGSRGGLLVVRPNFVVYLYLDVDQIFKREVYFSSKFAGLGSGSDSAILKRLYCMKNPPSFLRNPDVIKKLLRYSSLFDKYSDDDIVYESYKG